ncbi:MAG: efflux RND transporter periplasmic adaptor subunit [Oscillospiraceae bacterium]|nr:efflux RND transporter periplasmic adaptor subunit [Oscillospiraceae bacterium]
MKRRLIYIALTVCLVLSGCGVFPQEETYQSAPTIPQYAHEEWNFAYVRRGDMVLSKSVVCTYVPVQSETLSFSVSGLYFDEIFVSAGDSVKKGQLLAQLDISAIAQEIEECQLQLKKVELQMAALEENRALELQRQKLLAADKTAIKQINDRYDLQKQTLQDEKDIAQMKLNECNDRIRTRQLRAQIDGTVTYARNIKPGDRSVSGERVIVIEDSASSIFQADTRYWAAVVPGKEYVITVREEAYEAVAVSETELGIAETEKTEGLPAPVYFRLKDSSLQLEDGDRGMLDLTLDTREDVLMVPEEAVTQANGKTIVYYQDENGLKMYKTVEIGLTADGMTEIVSGLTEGERVIAG